MWKCPKCRTLNVNDICSMCSTAKPDGYVRKADNHHKPEQAGQSAGNNSAYSQNNQTANNFQLHDKKKNGKLIPALVITALILAAIAIAIIFMFLNSKKSASDPEPENRKSSFSDPKLHSDNTDPSSVNNEKDEPNPESDPNKDSEPGNNSEKPKNNTEDEIDFESPDSYKTYTNYSYNVSCAYPAGFVSVPPSGINALKTYESPDGSASMTIRACANPGTITVDDALKDFYSEYPLTETYKATGNSWYAISGTIDSDIIYRKFFMTDENIYCMDFLCEKDDLDTYYSCIEYIEDNFRTISN